MNEAIKAIVDKVPVKFTIGVILVILIWGGVLTGIAFFTNRSVTFLPPSIGSDPVLQAQVHELSKQAAQIAEREQAYRAQLRTALDQARDRSLTLSEKSAVGMTEAAVNVVKVEEELKVQNEKLLKEVEALQKSVDDLSKKI